MTADGKTEALLKTKSQPPDPTAGSTAGTLRRPKTATLSQQEAAKHFSLSLN